ncbi:MULTISPECIES: protein kinase domain-containing protein [unclassified Nocardiopsis]|uniref:protein kinase domain-containing protein n=1 Tax=Nocardiopsis TaxID=2013 RepID=UPI00387B4FD5
MSTSAAPRPRFLPLFGDDPRRVGPYRLLGRVGAGRLGTVYAARRPGGGLAAVKVVSPEVSGGPGLRERFDREIGAVARAQGPRLPALLGADPAADTPWLAVEFVPGVTLDQRLRRGPLPVYLVPGLAVGVAEALRTIHGAGTVHGDLTPANVMVSAGGPRVLDLGMVRVAADTVPAGTGGPAGTPGWIAPELYRGAQASAAADVFAWGAVVAYAATGRPPFGDGPAQAVDHRAAHGRADLEGVPPELLPLVRAALDPDPARRPPVPAILGELTRGEPAESYLARTWARVQPAVPEPPGRRPGRGVVLAAAAGALAVVVAAGLLGVRAYRAEAGQEPPAETAQEAVQAERSTPEEPVDRPTAWDEPAPVAEAENGAYVAVAGFYTLSEGDSRVEGLSGYGYAPGDEVAFVQSLTTGTRLSYSGFFAEVRAYDGGVEFVALEETYPPGQGAGEVASRMTLRSSDGSSFRHEAAEPRELWRHGDSTNSVVLFRFPGAPGRGLLTFMDEGYTEETMLAPPVSICYDAAENSFSLDYESCL